MTPSLRRALAPLAFLLVAFGCSSTSTAPASTDGGTTGDDGTRCAEATRCRKTCADPVFLNGCAPCPAGSVREADCAADASTGNDASDGGGDAQ